MIRKYYKYAVLDGKVMEGKKAIDMFNNGYGIEIYYSNNASDIVKELIKQHKNIKILRG